MKKSGQKFTSKYDVSLTSVYKGFNERIRIPGPDHFLYDPSAPTSFDELRMQAIDRDGKMTDPIELWTDPDEGVLWILDGRGRWLDVSEVNRRRAAEGRELVEPYLVPFYGDEKAAIARVREKNYHRRLPKPSAMALDLKVLRAAGNSYERCAEILHQDQITDAEQWVRKLLPIAYCVKEWQDAIDSGEFPRSVAIRVGGSAMDGSKAMGKREQLALLKEMREEREKRGGAPKATTVPPKARQRVADALGNGATEHLSVDNKRLARFAAAVLRRIDGDTTALKDYEEIESLFEAAARKPEKTEAEGKE